MSRISPVRGETEAGKEEKENERMDVEKASEVNSAFSALLASSLKLKPMGNELSASAMVFKSYGDNERNIIVSADLDTAKIFKDPS